MRVISLLLALILTLYGCTQTPIYCPTGSETIPDFQITGLDGTQFTLTRENNQLVIKFRGETSKPKGLLVHFFQPTCQACHDAMKELETLHVQFAKQGILVVGIAHRGETQAAESIVKRLNVTYTVLVGTGSHIALKLAGGDTIRIADSHGAFKFTQAGYGKGDENVWKENIQKLLAGQSTLTDITSRKALKVGETFPDVKLDSLLKEKAMSLTVGDGKLVFRNEAGKVVNPKAAIGFFSRY